MIENLFRKLKSMRLWNLLWISLILSEAFTAIMDILMGLLWWGRIDRDLMIIGSIDAFVVALFVSIILILLFREIRKSERQSEEAVLLAKEEWERTFNSMSDLIMILDKNHRVVRVNAAMAGKLGMTQSEAEGITCYKHVHGLTEPPPFCPHSMLMADGREHSAEVYEEGLGGFYLVCVTPLFDAAGEIVGSVHTAKDVSTRILAEQALRKSEEKFRTLFDSATDAIFILDMDGNFMDINRTAYERLGYSKDELLAMPLRELDTPEFASSVPFRMEQMSQKGKAVFESAHLRKDGTVMPVEINARVIEFGGKTAIISMIRDITRRKAAEIALHKSTVEKDSLIRNLEQALATIRTLQGILPICSSCKKIRDNKGYWTQIESYIRDHSEAEFTHGLCPECAKRLYPEIF